MLVLISDIHLTDGSSGETINPGAFELFTYQVQRMAEKAKAKEIEIVLLGDIFDVIRSDKWLQSSVRPWSEVSHKDGNGRTLEDYTKDIVDGICRSKNNITSVKFLQRFKEDMQKKGVEVRLTYVTGNHDWLINRYPETRVMAAEYLGMEKPEYYNDNKFDDEIFWEDYAVFARHGDIYDRFNFDGDRDASSLGDAIVIDLLNRFPAEIGNKIGPSEDPVLIKLLKEIDNVRPLMDVPIWVLGACRRAKTVAIGEKVKHVWNELVDEFLEIKFVKNHDKPFKLDVVDALQLCLRLTKFVTFERISRLPLKELIKSSDDYVEHAFQEDYMRRNEAWCVVYGHTHNFLIQPLDNILQKGNIIIEKRYFNTGTWRKIHVRVAMDKANQEFSGWHVMTFITFYNDNERKDKYFEVWNGALG